MHFRQDKRKIWVFIKRFGGAAGPGMDEDCFCAARSIVNIRDTEGKGKGEELEGEWKKAAKRSSKSVLTVIVFPPQPSGEQPPQGSSFPAPSLLEG